MSTFNTRIQNKIDTYANWVANNPTPLNGEICIVTVPAETGAVKQEPAVLIKVGNGTDDFKTLPFIGAKAADVSSWALADVKPEYTAEEIKGLGDYIGGQIQDSNTQYTIEQDATDKHILIMKKKDIGDAAYSEVLRVTTADTVYDDQEVRTDIASLNTLVGNTSVADQIAAAIAALDLANTYDAKGAADQALADAKDYADGKDEAIANAQSTADTAVTNAGVAKTAADNAQKAADDAQTDVDALELVVGTVESGKTVVGMIGENASAISTNAGKIAENTAAIATLNGTGEGSVDQKITDAFNDFSTKVSDDGVVNSYKELIDYAAENGSEFTKLVGTVTEHGETIAEHTESIADNAAGIEANAGEITALKGLVGSTAVATQISTAIDGALKTGGTEKYALVADLETAEGLISDNAEAIATINSKLGEIEDKADVNVIETVKVNGVALTPDASKAVDVPVPTGALASKDKVAEADLSSDLAAVIAAKAEDADLHKVAKSGDIADLEQASGYIVFNCGSSSVNV